MLTVTIKYGVEYNDATRAPIDARLDQQSSCGARHPGSPSCGKYGTLPRAVAWTLFHPEFRACTHDNCRVGERASEAILMDQLEEVAGKTWRAR